MTNQLEISRELAVSLLNLCTDPDVYEELRALLANADDTAKVVELWNPHPAEAHLASLLIVLGCAGVKVSGGTHGDPWTIAAPVVERQEPVALITVTEIDREYPSPGRNVYVTWLNDSDKTLSTGDYLYAEQPAPVAVALEMVDVMSAVQQARGFPVLTSNHCHCLAEALNKIYSDKVKELNQ